MTTKKENRIKLFNLMLKARNRLVEDINFQLWDIAANPKYEEVVDLSERYISKLERINGKYFTQSKGSIRAGEKDE